MTAQHTRRKSDADQDKSANQQIRTPKFYQQIRTPKFYKSGSPISSSGHPNSTFQIRTIKYWSKYELRTSNILESMDTHRFGQTRAPNSATRRIPPIRTSSTWTSTAAVSQVFGCPVLSSFVQPTPGTQNAPEIKPAGHQGVTVGGQMRTPKDFDRPGPPTLHPAGFSPSKQRLPGRRARSARCLGVQFCPVLSNRRPGHRMPQRSNRRGTKELLSEIIRRNLSY